MIRIVSSLILLLLSSAVALAQTPYYQGKTITFIVGSGAGTAYDMYSQAACQSYRQAHSG